MRVLAKRLELEWVAFPLEDAGALFKAAKSVDIMLHAAGRFAETCETMMDSCLAGKTHYLDISNEISVLQAAQARHRAAVQNGVSIIPGIGFGTVASNCLVRHVCEQIAEPVSLEVVISPYVAQKSAGAAKSTMETIARGGYVRRNGILVAIPIGSGARRIRTGNGEHNMLFVPSGDLEAAYMATGIADISVYMTTPLTPILARLLLPLVQKVLSWETLRKQLARWLKGRASNIAKPDDKNRRSWLWAQAVDRHGKVVEAWLETGEGYEFTASASIGAVEWVLANRPLGAMASGTAFGANFVLQIDGVQLHSH